MSSHLPFTLFKNPRHLELVSGSIGKFILRVVRQSGLCRWSPNSTWSNAEKWTPKQVQGDGHLGRGL